MTLAVDEAIDSHLDYQKLKDNVCEGMYLKKEVVDEWCKMIEVTFRFPDFAIQKWMRATQR